MHPGRAHSMDVVFIATTVGFWLLTWGFVRLCEKL
jgi:hypothetical protein